MPARKVTPAELKEAIATLSEAACLNIQNECTKHVILFTDAQHDIVHAVLVNLTFEAMKHCAKAVRDGWDISELLILIPCDPRQKKRQPPPSPLNNS